VHKNAIIISSVTVLLLFSFVSVIPPQINAASQSDGKPQSGQQVAQYDIDKGCATNTALIPNMKQFPTYFNCGHVTHFDNGTTLRKFSLVIEETHKIPITLPEDTKQSVMFPAWTFNASIPGPTMRMTQGDHVEVTVINHGTMAHSLHMHSIHPGNMDGVPIVSGESGFIAPGKSFTYRFIADPVGIFPYHCHMSPVAEHINRGLYGGMIIDPKFSDKRPDMKEIVMYLSGFDLSIHKPYPSLINITQANALLNQGADDEGNNMTESIADEHDNSIYAVNGIANYYMHHPINVTLHEPLRIYMFNMLDFEENSFHLHGQLFDYYPSATSEKPTFRNDVVSLSQGDRGIIETKFDFPGLYMAHAHIEQIGGRGWSSLFSVK
jgi:FtsP/CotA-like multicopper oxidase with cupredoxin domain